jgi:hypothetical protein
MIYIFFPKFICMTYDVRKGIEGHLSLILSDVCARLGYDIPEDIQVYTTGAVDRVVHDDYLSSPLGMEFMDPDSGLGYRTIGDISLVITGVFPEMENGKRRFYKILGSSAYSRLDSEKVVLGELFRRLSKRFDEVVDVLNAVTVDGLLEEIDDSDYLRDARIIKRLEETKNPVIRKILKGELDRMGISAVPFH